MCVCVFCWRNGALTCRYVQCDRARQNEEYMICICTCVCVYWCIMCLGRGGGCIAALSLCLSLSWNCKFLPLLLFCSSSFCWFSFLPSSNASVAFHSSPTASAAAANLRVWRITPRGGGEIARRCSGIELNWKGKQKQNLHRLAALLSSPYLPLSLFLRHLCPFILLLQKFSVNVHTHTHPCTNVPKCIVYVWVWMCVCVYLQLQLPLPFRKNNDSQPR